MENKIVKDFEKLRVIAACNIEGMDDLVNDLAEVLDESSTIHRASSADDICDRHMRTRWKKRAHKRRPTKTESYNAELCMGASNEPNNDLSDVIVKMSDSDEQISDRLTLTKLKIPENCVQTIESDSLAENCLSPIRSQRRRRKFKYLTSDEFPSRHPNNSRYVYKSKNIRKPTKLNPMESSCCYRNFDQKSKNKLSFTELTIPVKRKRTSTSRSDNCASSSIEDKRFDVADTRLENIDHQDSSSLTTSISDSDDMGMVTNDEAREADDEQSDFFHESGTSYNMSSVWERRDNSASNLDGLGYMLSHQSYSQPTFHLNHFFNKTHREIKTGRRKLKERKPRYTVTRFIQDRQNWKVMQSKTSSFWSNSKVMNQKGENKRRKPFCSGSLSGFIDESFEPDINTHMRRTRRRVPSSHNQMSVSSDS